MNDLGLYIHIPFCVKKCLYCDFLSFSGCESIYDEYTKKLCDEIKNSGFKTDRYIKTIFIGGGTPTVIGAKNLEYIMSTLFKNFRVENKAEITCEANPGTIALEQLLNMRSMGINRLSVGLQAWQNRLLKLLGRIHSREIFVENIKMARKAGFDNINCDLMFSLPTQTLNDWDETLKNVYYLNLEHISAYSLIIENGTHFKNMLDNGDIMPVDENIDRKMYYMANDFLKSKNYKRYEISNFAKHGYESKHNITYWQTKEYIGFGLGAHSYINGKRFNNIKDLKKYLSCQNYVSLIENSETITQNEAISEFMFMGLRMTEGISENEFEKRFNKTIDSVYKNDMDFLIKNGLLKREKGYIFLTDYGVDLSNFVFEKLFIA